MSPIIPVLLVSGSIGVGKTTVATEMSAILDRHRMSHALVDMDALRWRYPADPSDPFSAALGLQNLAAVWRNCQLAGAERLVLVDIVESRAQLPQYGAAIPGATLVVVRLCAATATLAARIAQREVGAGYAWHLERSAELAALMEREQVEDLAVENDGRPLADVAGEVLRRCNWLSASER